MKSSHIASEGSYVVAGRTEDVGRAAAERACRLSEASAAKIIIAGIEARHFGAACHLRLAVPVLETGIARLESHLHIVHTAATVLCHDEFGQAADVIAGGIDP